MSKGLNTHFMRTCGKCGHYEIDDSADIAQKIMKNLESKIDGLEAKINRMRNCANCQHNSEDWTPCNHCTVHNMTEYWQPKEK